MDDSTAVQNVGSNNVQVEVVTADGHPVTPHPIRVEELLQQQKHTLDVGGGIALRLEELNAEQNYSDDDTSEDDHDDATSSASSFDAAEGVEEGEVNSSKAKGGERSGASSLPPPPGTRATSDWYDVLDALRREQQDVERTTAAVESQRRVPQEGEGRLVTRHPNDVRSVATPLKRFSNLPSTATRSIAGDRSASPLPPGASRHAVWAALAPPADGRRHNYKVLRYVSYMGALDCRKFRPTALAFHATAAYLSRKDRGQRFLVYGGLSVGCRKVEQELYEFSVLTGNWRRIEGRQLAPAGHYGHTMTVVEAVDRLVVVGGIGPGGNAVTPATARAWTDDPQRAPRYQALCPLLRRGGIVGGTGVAAATRALAPPSSSSSAPPLGLGAPSRPSAVQTSAAVGFVPLLFDMSLSELTWRAIQPAQAFPLAFHTAVHSGKEIFIFGGLTDELRVSGQLLALHPETYAVRLITTMGRAAATASLSSAAASRSRRARSASTKASTEDETATGGVANSTANATTTTAAARAEEEGEAAGPGPRFLHTAVTYGPYMIIFGGYNAHNEPQNDCWAFDTVNERWEKLRCRGEVAPRAGHECCVVGCRMIVTGGFECGLDEVAATKGASAVATVPVATVMELNLVPTPQGEHLWRSDVKLHPALPPLAFTRCAPCGDDHSFLLFGGLTRPPRPLPRRGRSQSAGRRGGSAATRRQSGVESGEDSDDAESTHEQPEDRHKENDGTVKRQPASGHKGLLGRLAPFDDGLVFTFPLQHQRGRGGGSGGAGAPAVNALGVEVDPNELPEHFKTFVRRQEDFVKKRDAAAEDTVRKITLEEQEGMEPALYLTDDEIELLLQRSEECCAAFAQRYPMTSLPSNVPDREERVRIVEECVSKSRQVRDVLKSMKGSAPGVTAVKSKSHRKRAGQKFEDYSAAKPFRRVVVAHLLEGINAELSQMHRLNKALRTVDWEEKGVFLEAVSDMQGSVHAVSQAISRVMRRYIQHRVDSLVKGVDRHKEVMRQLTQVVEKNRHDKIWGVEAARDAQRADKNKQANAAAAASGGRSASAKDATRSRTRSTAAAPVAGASGRGKSRSRSLGGGYHADEAKAVVHLMDRAWAELLARTQAVEKCAGQLQHYCLDTVAATAPQGSGLVPGAAAPSTAQSLLPLPPPSLVAAPPTGGLPLPTPQAPATMSTMEGTQPLVVPAAAGSARPRDIIIRRSNALREQTAAVAQEVGAAAVTFYAALTTNAQGGAAGHDDAGGQGSSRSSSSPSAPVQAGGAALEPPPVLAVGGQQRRPGSAPSSRSSSASSSSSSVSGGAAAVAPVPAGALPMPVVPLLGLPQPAAPPPPPPPPLLPPQPGTASNTESVAEQRKKVKTAVVTPGAVEGHAVHLSALRPLLTAKETLLARKGSVSLILKNVWDGNDLAGAPQDVKVEELYKRLEKLVTAVAQSVTAAFLSKAGARPPRVRPATASVAPLPPPPPRTSSSPSRRVKKAAALLSPAPQLTQQQQQQQPPPPPHATAQQESGSDDSKAKVTLHAAAGQHAPTSAKMLRLRPLPASTDDEDWWKVSPTPNGGDAPRKASGAAAAAAPLVSAEALLRDVRLNTAGPTNDATSAAAAQLQIQPVFHDVRTVPNRESAGVASRGGAGGGACLREGSTGPWSPAVATAGARRNQADAASAMVSLSAVPKVVMPSTGMDGGDDLHPWPARAGASPSQRRQSTIEELTQLPPTTALAADGGGGDGEGMAQSLLTETGTAAREPITSITGGNFAVNTEYLYRVSPQTMPRKLGDDSNGGGAVVTDPTSVDAARHAWADVDDDYFYFGRPAENRVAPVEAVAGGPPYVSMSPTLTTGRVGVSQPVGTVVASSRLNAELTSAGASATAHRRSSSSARRGEVGGFRGATASQAQKTQTARVVRKEGTAARNFYTPGELLLMQARERLRAKPQRHQA